MWQFQIRILVFVNDIRMMSKYRLSDEYTEDKLTTIQARVFGKYFVSNFIETLPIQSSLT
jgi:hypothetical protein